jgi:hypothetical protein
LDDLMTLKIGPLLVSVSGGSAFARLGVQIGGHGQDGVFVYFGRRTAWIRVWACGRVSLACRWIQCWRVAA